MNKKNNWIIGIVIGVLLIVCLVSVLIVFILQKSNDNEEDIVNNNNGCYSDSNNDIDRMIAKIYDKNDFITGVSRVRRYDYRIENTENNMPDIFTYEGTSYHKGNCYVEKEYVGEEIGVDDEYGLSFYKINGITEKFSIAVKEGKTENYWSYSRFYEEEYQYIPETLNDLFNSLGFYDNIKNIEVELYNVNEGGGTVVYYDETGEIMDRFFKEMESLPNEKKENENNWDVKKTGLSVSVTLDHIEETVIFDFYENGDINISCHGILGNFYRVHAGDDSVKFAINLLEYLEENVEGYYHQFPVN